MTNSIIEYWLIEIENDSSVVDMTLRLIEDVTSKDIEMIKAHGFTSEKIDNKTIKIIK